MKQEDRTLTTDDQAKAKAYEQSIKSYKGWTATSNFRPHAKATESGDVGSKTVATLPGYYSDTGSANHWAAAFPRAATSRSLIAVWSSLKFVRIHTVLLTIVADS